MIERTDSRPTVSRKQEITVTPAAAAEIRRLMDKEEEQGIFLRIGISTGGCSGMSYSMGFDTARSEDDAVFDFERIEVRVDRKALAYLNGTIVDYAGGMLGGGFQFSNPNARRSCGCGTSFTC